MKNSIKKLSIQDMEQVTAGKKSDFCTGFAVVALEYEAGVLFNL